MYLVLIKKNVCIIYVLTKHLWFKWLARYLAFIVIVQSMAGSDILYGLACIHLPTLLVEIGLCTVRYTGEIGVHMVTKTKSTN